MVKPFRLALHVCVLVLALAPVSVCSLQAALPLDPPEAFFTNVADRLLQQQLGLRLTDVRVAPTSEYSSAVHRIFQVTANIYDATTTNEFPAVFRPLFNVTSNSVSLAGFTNDASASTLPSWLESNPYGVPLVIAARKGIPNFNEFTVRGDITVQRKLQVVRSAPIPNGRPVGTNQMYVVSVSNYFGVEAWNSLFSRYRRPATLTVSNFATLWMSNELGSQTNQVVTMAATQSIGADDWRGAGDLRINMQNSTNSFRMPLHTNAVFLSNAVYRFGDNKFVNASTNDFEPSAGFPLPRSYLVISNRLTYVMSEGDRILDFVQLNDAQEVDLHRDLITGNPYENTGAPSTIAAVWGTNRMSGATAPTDGIRQQMQISLGIIPTANWDWRAFTFAMTANENDKQSAIDAFRIFHNLAPLATNQVQTNYSLVMETPFNPVAKLSAVKTWQANDPLVHYHVHDLLPGIGTNHQFLRPIQPGTNIAPASVGRVNDRYAPWGGPPNSSVEYPGDYDRSLRDPGAYSSDDWRFPRGAALNAEWLGRIHRGTPWQSIYLKADATPAATWLAEGRDARSHPTNDWRMAALLAMLFNTNDVRALASINSTNEVQWTNVFTGMLALTNTNPFPALGEPPIFETNVITPDAPQLPFLLDGIRRMRTAQRGQYFADVTAFLSVPELSSALPWLNLDDEQLRWGLTDEAYEILPAQLLSRIRPDPVATIARAGAATELRFTAFDGYAYRVEGSIDAATWSTVSEPHDSSNGVFTVTIPAGGEHRFFRAVLP